MEQALPASRTQRDVSKQEKTTVSKNLCHNNSKNLVFNRVLCSILCSESCSFCSVFATSRKMNSALLACCCHGCIVKVKTHMYANLSVKMWCHSLDRDSLEKNQQLTEVTRHMTHLADCHWQLYNHIKLRTWVLIISFAAV